MAQNITASFSETTDDATIANLNRFIDQCLKLWAKYETRGLDARHALGTLLNKQLETAAKRRKHGAQVLKRAAQALDMSRSEMTRMMQLAKQFANVRELQQQHPTCKNWTQAKKLLAKPSARMHATDRSGKSPMSGVVKSITRITAKFRSGELPREETEAVEFQRNLQELIEAAQAYLQVETQRSVA